MTRILLVVLLLWRHGALTQSSIPFFGSSRKQKSERKGPAKPAAELFLHGFMVNIDLLPPVRRFIPHNLSWSEFENVNRMRPSAAFDLYSAEWNGRKVVLKSIRSKQMRESSSYEIEREISVLGRLDHPNIIQLLGSGRQPFRFEVLEHLEGGTLDKILTRSSRFKKLPAADLLSQEKMFEYAIKVADALHYIHERFHPGVRVFHRDVKPENIGLTANGEIKLFDFGLADAVRKTVDENVLFPLVVGSENGKPVGTWQYAAPEVMRRENYNHKSDVYSFAIILHYILVGRHPMQHIKDHNEMRAAIAIHDGWRPSLKYNHWPDELIHLFAQMWNDDVYARPGMEDIVKQLTNINYKNPNFINFVSLHRGTQ